MSKVEFLFKTNTLRGRLRVFILNLILFVILVFSIFLMNITKSQIKSSYENELSSIVKMQNQAITKWLNKRELDIHFLANSSFIKTKKLEEIEIFFEEFINSQSEFYFVSFIDKNGQEIQNSTFLEKKNFKEYEFFKQSIQGFDFISDAQIDTDGKMPVIHFSSTVFDENNEIIGMVVGAVRLSSIQAIIESFRFGETGETFILNNQNKVLTKRRFEQENLFKEDIISYIAKKEVILGYYEKEVLSTFEITTHNRWKIVAQISKEEIFKVFEQFLIYTTFFITVLLFILVPLILRFSNKIERPLQFLLHGSKKIQDGNYGHTIDENSIIYATSEIKDLTATFNSMSEQLGIVISDLTTRSTIDMLSKLYNRAELLKRSQKAFELAKEKEKSCTVFIIDIDHFKNINDTYGHRSGDVAIELVANSVKTSLCDNDIAGRYGGEEFMVFLSDITRENAINIAQRVRKNIEKLLILNENHTFKCTCSIGIYYTQPIQNTLTLEQMIEKADQALYEAKHNGRNRVVCTSY